MVSQVMVVQRRNKIRLFLAGLLLAPLCPSATAQNNAQDQLQTLLRQGFDLHQQARFAEAIPILNRARQLAPNDYFVNLLLGIDLLRSGHAAEAIPHLKLAAQRRPSEEFPVEYLGEAEAQLGRYSAAVEAYQSALLRSHNSEQALEAWAGFALERFRQISAELRASQPGLAVAHRLQVSATHPEKGVTCPNSLAPLERELAIMHPDLNTEAAYQLSLCYAVDAGKAAEQLQTGAQDMAAVHQLQGDVLLRLKGDPAAAKGEYQQAIALRPNDPGLLERLAEAEVAAGEPAAAEQSAKAALAIDPHRREALRTLAELAMNDRDYERALTPLRKLVAQDPADRAAAVELAKALAETGQPAESLHVLTAQLAAGYPDEKGALHELMARSLRRLGRNDEAIIAENEARRLSDAFQTREKNTVPGSPDAHQ